MPSTAGTIIEIAPERAKFIVALAGEKHAGFTLRSYAILQAGDQLIGDLEELGVMWIMPTSRQRFQASGDTGPTTLEACREWISKR